MSKTGRRVLVVQEAYDGHRLSYVAMVAREALAHGLDVDLMVPAAAVGSHEWRAHLGRVAERATVVPAGSFAMSEVRTTAARTGAERIVFPDGDVVLRRLYARGSWPWSRRARITVLVMRTQAQKVDHPVGRRARTVAKLALRSLARGVFGIRVLELVSSLSPEVGRHQVRDPVTMLASVSDRPRLREAWGLDPSRHWFAVLGVLTERKNVPLVMRALSRADAPVGVLLAGRVARGVAAELPPYLRLLDEVGVAYRVEDRMLSELELDEAIVASDTVVLAHSNEGPSGILGKAAAAGTRVVCAGAWSLRQDLASAPHIGEWVELGDEALVGAFDRACRRPRTDGVTMFDAQDFALTLLGTR